MRASIISVLLLVLCPGFARAGDPRIDNAVERGRDYVLARQDRRDGLFKDKWFHAYPAGETALSLLTLLKAGVEPDQPAIKHGFRVMMAAPLKKVYSVSIGILAVEARYEPTAVALADTDDPYRTVARKKFKRKASPKDRRWLGQAANFLIRNQRPNGLWNYPHGGDDDLSNAQFALLALKSASRLGIAVPDEVWGRSLKYLLDHQESNGPKVESFPVPAASGPIRLLGKKGSGGGDTVERERTSERVELFARGWGYKPGQGPRGSMVAAGVACLVVIKSELEARKGYQRRYAARVDKSIRDGAAWLASRFKADQHPGAELDWLFYYLYTLERAGTLTGCESFGSHAWYRQGAEEILKLQQGDGRFERNTAGEHDGALAGSCFAILFLKRSTVPVIERVVTGTARPAAGGEGLSKRRLDDGRCEVLFRFRPPQSGARVTLAGSFNNWNKDQHVLNDSNGDGVHEIAVILGPGSHSYKFVVNGEQWLTDPKNSRRSPDGLGGENSLIEVP